MLGNDRNGATPAEPRSGHDRPERAESGRTRVRSASPAPIQVRIGGPALADRIAQRPLLQMGIRDGEYRGDVPRVPPPSGFAEASELGCRLSPGPIPVSGQADTLR
jgi:hypothetical protein